ncbi:Putative sodium-coupled neutral amino acid transporter 7 [Coccomyxa sp. Obi]|nr:Putative sodium-coupled neutral amino acid transporter 7 [Coccomyxa sp. Obi]
MARGAPASEGLPPPDTDAVENGSDGPAIVRIKVSPGGTRPDVRILISEDEEGSSSMSSVFTLCNSAIGAGVLSLPYAFRKSGCVGCLILCLVLGACEAFTLYVLSKFAERYQAHTYSGLVRKALGRKLSASLSAILILYLWGSCIAYLVIIGDSFSPLIALGVGDESFLADRRFVITTIGMLLILPMCFPRELGALAWVSMAAVIGFMYTAIVIVIRGTEMVMERGDLHDVKLFRWSFDALFAVPIVVFGFNCHANVVTIFTELDKKPALLIGALPADPAEYAALPGSFAPRPRSHKMVGMLGVIISAITVIMLGYLMVGFSGYLAFPTSVEGNVLKSFPTHDILMQVARGVIGAVVTGHYPLNHHPARLAMEHLEQFAFGWKDISVAFSAVQSIIFIVTTIAVANVVTDLGAVLHMVGGTAASYMIFFLPGLLLINAAIVKRTASMANLAEEGQEGNGNATASSATSALESQEELAMSFLASSNEQGIKRVGLIYSPRKSWWAGMTFVVLSIVIFIITIVTAFVQ